VHKERRRRRKRRTDFYDPLFTREIPSLAVRGIQATPVAILTLSFLKKYSILWDITPCSLLKTDVSEEHIASIFNIEEKGKHETSVNYVASRVPVFCLAYPSTSETSVDLQQPL
jgi:hypothetical protein